MTNVYVQLFYFKLVILVVIVSNLFIGHFSCWVLDNKINMYTLYT